MPYQVLPDGVGFLPGSFCPHYDAEAARKPIYRQAIAEGKLADGYACDNSVAVRCRGRELVEFVGSRADARAWRITSTQNGYEESEIVPRFLGDGLLV
jgi:dipeptidase E